MHRSSMTFSPLSFDVGGGDGAESWSHRPVVYSIGRIERIL